MPKNSVSVHLHAIYQRTQFESKSQHAFAAASFSSICMQSIKEHNLKANHNTRYQYAYKPTSACNLSKNTIWKQITTALALYAADHNLHAIYQRTQFESKSQLVFIKGGLVYFCMQSIKEHNLKANHNIRSVRQLRQRSACNLSKNTIWKQITTISFKMSRISALHAIYQRTQFESKSQRKFGISWVRKSACNLSKNTIWKQITTISLLLSQLISLHAIYQRTQFESKSQLAVMRIYSWSVCMQSIKEHNLKANHNAHIEREPEGQSACNLSKNTIWKQITTYWRGDRYVKDLHAIYQRTQFESKSQLLLTQQLKSGICMQSIKEHNLKANHN